METDGAQHGGIGHRPGLDGLRAIAVATVIAFHLDRMPGGFLGVDLFFVISGWLITSQLLAEMNSSQTLRLRAFWIRRGRRLMPASLLVIATVVLTWVAVGPKVVSLRHDTFFALFWSSNWGTIANGGNYWAHFSAPSPLLHFWSLAVEEQFYFVWPVLAFGLWKLLEGHRRALAASFAALAIASIVWMNVSFQPTNPTATYMSTFARAHSLLIGAFVAAITSATPSGIRAGRWFRAAAPVAGLGVIGMMLVASSDSVWLYRWGFPTFAVACIVVIVAAADGWGVRFLGSRVMRWVGDRSYGLYLWHWPVVLLLSPDRLHVTSGFGIVSIDVLRVLVSVALATVSLWLIENPIRRRRVLRSWRAPLVGAMTAASVVSLAIFVVPAAPSAAPSVVTLPPPPPAAASSEVPLVTITTARAATTGESSSSVASAGLVSSRSANAVSRSTETSVATTAADAIAGAAAAGAVPPPHLAAVVPVSAVKAPVRVLVTGDSTAVELANDVDVYAGAHPDQMVAGRSAFGGCGMTAAADGRLHRFKNGKEWIDLSGCVKQWQSIPERVAAEKIDVVLISIGPWDGDDIRFPNGKVISVLDPAGKELVKSIYQRFVASVEAAGARIVWVTPADVHMSWATSTNDPLDNPARWTTMRGIIADLGVEQIDLPDWLTFTANDGPDGRPDGVHMAPAVDAQFVNELVAPILTEPKKAP